MLFSLPSALFSLALLPFSLTLVVRYQRHNFPIPMRTSKRQLLPQALVAESNAMPWTISSEQICKREESQRQQCNAHNKLFECTCPSPVEAPKATTAPPTIAGLAACQALLPHVERPEEQLITIGVAFPLLLQFMEDPERIFLEDLEIFTFIPRESVVIYRRGCSVDSLAYEFQFGILASNCRQRRGHPPQLRTLSPRIFLSNPFFMNENALKIAYIRAGSR